MLVGNTTQFNNPYRRKPKIDYCSSTPQSYTNTRYNSKPLEVQQQTFKGFYNFAENLVVTKTEILPQALFKKTLSTLSEVSELQHKTYSEIIDSFIEKVKKDSSFRNVLNISEDWASSISKDKLPELPQKGVLRKFAETVFSPITSLFNLHKPILRTDFGKTIAPKTHARLLKEKGHEELIEKYKSFIGLNKSVKIWENSYRRFSGNPHWAQGDDLLIPDDVLLHHLNTKRLESFDPKKGKYSTKSLMLGNRLTSGIIYSVYLSTDAYNTTMKFSGDKEESSRQRKSRFVQENARIGLNLYLQNLIFSTMEHSMNKNMATALLASGASVALSEIIGRQLVSKPIMPSNKKTLDSLEKDMQTKKGFFPALGRLMTRVKKTDANPKIVQSAITAAPVSNNPFQSKPFSSFGATPLSNKVAFKGFDKTAQMFDAKALKVMLERVEKFDKANFYRNTIENELKRIKNIGGNDVSGMSLDKILDTVSAVPIGEKDTVQGKVVKSVFAPVYWVKSWAASLKKFFKNVSSATRKQEMSDFVKNNGMESEYKKFLEDRLNLAAWKNSALGPQEKSAKILEEFVTQKEKIKKDVQSVRNFLLWMEKQIKTNKFDLSALSDEQKKTLEDSIQKAIVKSDGSTHQEYDGNLLSQLNIHVARAITTIFLVTDAYNLTMQYSNDNKKASKDSAKGRFVQESARISVSAYMLGFIHNLLSKVCNSGLIGAFGVTALTSIANDTLTRLIVGVPLTPQSQEQLTKKGK